MTYKEIGEALGVSETTAQNWTLQTPCITCKCDRDSRKGWKASKCPDCCALYRKSLDERGCNTCGCDHDSRKGWLYGKCPDCIRLRNTYLSRNGCQHCGCDHDSRIGWKTRTCPDCVSKQRQSRNEKGCRKCKCDYDSRKGWHGGCCPTCVRCDIYNISIDQFRQLPESCQICGNKQNMCIDHCHSGDYVRGRLCSTCNTGIGMFQDNPEILEKAIKYLNSGPFQFSPHESQ